MVNYWNAPSVYWYAVALATAVCLPNLAWIVYASRRAWSAGLESFLRNLRDVSILNLAIFTVAEWLFLYNLLSDYFDIFLPHWLWVGPLGAWSHAPQAAALWATLVCLPNISWTIYRDLGNWRRSGQTRGS